MERESFKEYSEKFLVYLKHEKDLSGYTLQSYEGDLAQLEHFWLTLEQAQQKKIMSSHAISSYERWLFGQKFSLASIARKCSCLATFNRFLLTQGVQGSFFIQRPFLAPKVPGSLHFSKLITLFDELKNEQLPTKYPYRDRALIELLYATGISSSELSLIMVEDIDFQEKTIAVYGSKKRVVLFGSQAYQKMLLYMHYERGSYCPLEPFFVNYKKGQLTARSIQRICRMFGEVVGEKQKITPMLFRNSFTLHLLAKGADTALVKELLGYTTDISIEKYKHKKACPSIQKK